MEPTILTLNENADNGAAPDAPRVKNALQDRRTAERITRALEIITATQNDAALMARLAPRGFTAERIAQGLPLQAAAQTAYNARQQAIAVQLDASAALAAAVESARAEFSYFRRMARTLFTDPAARAALGLDGRVPHDLETFISIARAAYANALAAPAYQTPLSSCGYDTARLESLQAALDNLIALEHAHQAARTNAVRATRERDDAYATLERWLRRLQLATRVAAFDQPAIALYVH